VVERDPRLIEFDRLQAEQSKFEMYREVLRPYFVRLFSPKEVGRKNVWYKQNSCIN
jgi:hypothetical protein